ncbi:MAG: hypothetical protein AAGA03_20020, partial [Planctomycetota bacterium]
SYSFVAAAGVPLEVTAKATGSIMVEKDCDGSFKACASLGVSLEASVGPKIAGTVTVTDTVSGFTETVGATASVSLKTGVSGSVSYCTDTGLDGQLCFDGVSFEAKVELAAGKFGGVSASYGKDLADKACIPDQGGASAAMFEPLFASLNDNDVMAQWAGFDSEADLIESLSALDNHGDASAVQHQRDVLPEHDVQPDQQTFGADSLLGASIAEAAVLDESFAPLTVAASGPPPATASLVAKPPPPRPASPPMKRQSTRDADALVPSPHLAHASTGDDGVCARVRLRLEQEAILTRTAFQGALEIENPTGAPLTEVDVQINVYDEDGTLIRDAFAISDPAVTNFTNDPNSTSDLPLYLLPSATDGVLRWTLLPTDLAAPDGPRNYRVGGLMTYKLNGESLTIPLEPAPITVYPDAKLALKYFHQRDVYADDPFTDPVEPSVPYDLGIMVTNSGLGTARNLTINSAQPKIIENEKGLAIDFEIVGSEINGVPAPGSLNINFGDIAPNEISVGRWQLTSSLQGQFSEYSATFEHLTGLGDARTSIIQSVEIFELIHTVQDTRDGADALLDFLTNEVEDPLDA